MNMKTKRFQRTAAMLLCIFICAWTMFPLMGAAFAAEGLHDTAEAEITCCVEGGFPRLGASAAVRKSPGGQCGQGTALGTFSRCLGLEKTVPRLPPVFP